MFYASFQMQKMMTLGGNNSVRYVVSPESDPMGRFGVNEAGVVVLAGALDRETTRAHTVLVWAVDDGTPTRTATATLTVNVTDVNDNPPFLREPQEVQVEENAEPQVVARVKLGDRDSWGRGHGPPFTLALDPRAPPHVAAVIKVSLDPGDEGRGVGMVETRASLDREAGRVVLVPLVVGDAGRPHAHTTTVTLTVHVGDVNDNPMTPASKSVTALTLKAFQGRQLPVALSDVVPLGRVYVRDPDDWDAAAKTYSWRGSEHPNFRLDTATGHLTMRPATGDGRYQLGFTVSDAAQGQFGVKADVTVEVRSLKPHDVSDATPLTLEATPYEVVRDEGSGSVLSRMVWAARAWVTGGGVGVMVVSVEPLGREPPQRTRLGEAAGVTIGQVGVGACREGRRPRCGGGCVLRAGLSGQFSVVDANTSAVAGPRLALHTTCGCGGLPAGHATPCIAGTCLNHGRCVHIATRARCVCPYHTHGSRCKVLARHFKGGHNQHRWAWTPPLPACAKMHLSLEVLTRARDATLLYSGPDRPPPTPAHHAARDMVALELRGGRPSLLVDLGGGPVSLGVDTTAPISDNTWHRLDVLWTKQVVLLLVDLCSGGTMDPTPTPDVPHNHSTTAPPQPPEPHTCRARGRLPAGGQFLDVSGPLQVGGLAHPPPPHAEHGWPRPLVYQPFSGCVRNLRVNGETPSLLPSKLVDLGHGLLGHHSAPGCPDANCASKGLSCGPHSKCGGSPGSLRCDCLAGWTGDSCTTPTQPTSFLPSSYVRLALSFIPLPHTTSLQLR
ncbi:putative neural-cadherin 2 [Chionoecetes opilio]|uniref:Putative neural-cadherin 2 n=1 Tax=Chionoecetes opilio TaxID=41210 RepID=A0A8J4XQY0_CHIOP|nr:putative neural-cadherin 2 [Chionoecetes opilio]